LLQALVPSKRRKFVQFLLISFIGTQNAWKLFRISINPHFFKQEELMRLSGPGIKDFLLAFSLLLMAASVSSVTAQTGTSLVKGIITDAQGNVVAGAKVTLTSPGKNFQRTQVTNNDGQYTFASLPPDTYDLTVEATGFKKAAISGIKGLVDTSVTQNVTMEVGNVSEVVTVSSADLEALTNKEDATIGNVLVPHQIQELPIENQNINTLLTLQPGVTKDGYVAGARSDQSNIMLDGVDNNEQQIGSQDFTSVLRTTTSSTEEFRVTVANPNANQGRSSGAQISLVTKSGDNNFHGTLYEFNRTKLGEANDFFSNRDGVGRPNLVRNVFGGALGGPVIKNKFFFFYNYEGYRQALGIPTTRLVPLASLGRGEVRYPNTSGGTTTLTASQINALFPSALENPIALAFLASAAARYPANDLPGPGDGYNTGGFRFNNPTHVNENTHIMRLDYNLKKSQQIFFRTTVQHDLNDLGQYFPDTPQTQLWSHPWGFVIGHTWQLGSNKVNNFRYGLTREAFTQIGDFAGDRVVFRGMFQPFAYNQTLSRKTPVHSFVDDFSWIKGSHTFQFGTNIRLIKNERVDFSKSYDNASTNYFFYSQSGSSLSTGITGIATGFRTNVRIAVSGVLGRFSQYTENFNYDLSKALQPTGSGVPRTFATEQYDFYGQDTWKLARSLTLNLGLRWGVGTPVYETQGYMVAPSIPLGEFLRLREQGAYNGTPYNTPLTVDLAGSKYNKPGYYKTDWNNFQPRVSAAWSPSFHKGFLKTLFGSNSDSVFRGGFGMLNDNFGQALAVNFEGNNQLGFSTSRTISANTYNTTSRLGPLFTGLGQQIRGLPGITVPSSITFPQSVPSDMQRRIEGSLDSTLQTPVNYLWNFSFGRKLPGNFYVEASYIGRHARHLLTSRDVATPNNLRDPLSNTDWYTAAGQLEMLRSQHVDVSAVPDIPFFRNVFGPGFTSIFADALGDDTFLSLNNAQAVYYLADNINGYGVGNDWTTMQDIIDSFTDHSYFYNPQYGALAAYSTIGKSDYDALTISVRQRLKKGLTFDLNYTFSKSFDTASGLQTSGVYGAAVDLNPFTPDINRAVSDFDARHILNISGIWQLPVGRGAWIGKDMPHWANSIIGGWQLSGIYRYNSGEPAGAPFDDGHWATNWEIESNGVRIRPISTSSTRGGNGRNANLFSDPVAAYQSFRNARPGEVGDRNIFRFPAFTRLDLGLAKTFKMPWEGHSLEFRWDVFNATNTQPLTGIENFALDQDPFQAGQPGPGWGDFNAIQGDPRRMQFAFRYRF